LRIHAGLVLALFWIALPPCLCAEKKQNDREKLEQAEAREAEQEALEEAKNEAREIQFVGTLTLDANTNASVIGTLETRNETLKLKVYLPDLRETLAKFDGKTVTVTGFHRNKQKYFVVYHVLENASIGAGWNGKPGGL
jgi:hypothetical protein